MSIREIGSDQVLQSLRLPAMYVDRLASKGSADAKGLPSERDPVNQNTIVRRTNEYNRRIVSSHRAFEAAGTLRRADQAMEGIEKTLERMEGDLEVITKNYPPFPPGSEERVKRLRSYAALRAMIDQLTVPPNAEAGMPMAGKNTEDPAAVSDEWTYQIGPQGLPRTVQREKLHTGPTGLNIPELTSPETVDDASIARAAEAVRAAREQIAAERERLRADAVDQGWFATPNGQTVPLNDTQALMESAGVRGDLAGMTEGISAGGFSQFEQLLR